MIPASLSNGRAAIKHGSRSAGQSHPPRNRCSLVKLKEIALRSRIVGDDRWLVFLFWSAAQSSFDGASQCVAAHQALRLPSRCNCASDTNPPDTIVRQVQGAGGILLSAARTSTLHSLLMVHLP